MEKNELISVIVPIYNVEKYLKECVDSILSQTYCNIEIILVNDGSTDKSLEICKKYDNNYSNVLLVNQKNAGLGMARNSGIRVAKGKYVIFVDSDDYIETEMISNLYRDMIDNGADTVIAGYKKVYNQTEKKERNIYAGNTVRGENIKTEVLSKMFADNGQGHIEMSVWKTLFSMDIIKNNNIDFPDRSLISEDIIFDIKYFTKSQCVFFSDDTSYCYRFNQNSLSQGYRKEKFELLIFQTKKMKQMILDYDLPEECITRVDFYLLGNTLHFLKQLIANENKRYAIHKIEEIIKHDSIRLLNWKPILKKYGVRNRIMAAMVYRMKVKGTYYTVRIISDSSRKIKDFIILLEEFGK